MSDWDLTEKRIYKLLRHPYQLDKSVVEDMASAYLEFVEELFDYLNRIGDNKIRIRQLNMSYIDFGTFKALEESCPTENSKLKLVFLDKLLSLINMEQELIYRQMEYPKFFINIESEWKSPFYLNNEVIKLVDMMELVCGIFYISDAASACFIVGDTFPPMRRMMSAAARKSSRRPFVQEPMNA